MRITGTQMFTKNNLSGNATVGELSVPPCRADAPNKDVPQEPVEILKSKTTTNKPVHQAKRFSSFERDVEGYTSIRKLGVSPLWRENLKFKAEKLAREEREESGRIAAVRNPYHRPVVGLRDVEVFKRADLIEVIPVLIGSSIPNAPQVKVKVEKIKPMREIFSIDFVFTELNRLQLHYVKSGVLHYWNSLKMKKGYGKCQRTIDWCLKTFSKVEIAKEKYDPVSKKVEFVFSSKKKLHKREISVLRKKKMDVILEGNVVPKSLSESAQIKVDVGLTLKTPIEQLYQMIMKWLCEFAGLKDVEHLISVADVANLVILLNAEDGTTIANAAWMQFFCGGFYKLSIACVADLPGTIYDIFSAMVGSEPRFKGNRPETPGVERDDALFRARVNAASMGFHASVRTEYYIHNDHERWEAKNHPGPVDSILAAAKWQFDVGPNDVILHARDKMLIKRLQVVARLAEMDPRVINYSEMLRMQRGFVSREYFDIPEVEPDDDYYGNLSKPRVTVMLRILAWARSLPVHVRSEQLFVDTVRLMADFLGPEPDYRYPDMPDEELEPEGSISEMVELARWLVLRVKNAPLVVKVISFFSFMVSSSLFSCVSDRMQFLLKALGLLTGLVKEGADGVAIFFDFAADMAKGFEEYMSGSSFGAAFFKIGASEQMIKDLTAMKIELGSIRSNPKIDPRSVLLRAEILITKKSLIDSKDPLVISGRREIEEMRLNVMAGLNVSRLQPAGVIITGPPGSGKSHLITEFSRSLKKRTGLPMDINNTHVHTGTKHQSLPSCVQQYVVNDAFQTKDEFCELSMMDLMQVMVDTTPMKPETASISEKNMSYIAPMLSTITTNVKRFVMSKATGGANKMDRRYLSIEVVYARHLMKKYLTEQAVRLAIDNDPWEQGNFEYRVGRMSNDNSNVLNVLPVRDLTYHKTLASVAKVVMMEVDKRSNAPEPTALQTCDVCGVCKSEVCLCGHYICPCGIELGLNTCDAHHSKERKLNTCNLCDHWECVCEVPPPPVLRRNFRCGICRNYDCNCIVPEGMVTIDFTSFALFIMLLLNSSAFLYYVLQRPILTVRHTHQIPNFLNDENGVQWGRLQLLVKAALGLAALRFAYVTFIKPSYVKEGALITQLSEVVKEEKYVRPFLTRATPWVNTESTTFSFSASVGSVTTRGFMLTHELALLPLHLFSLGGDKLTISTGFMSLSFKIKESMMWTKGGGSDMRICYLPGIPSVFDPAYLYLHTEYFLPEGKTMLGSYEVTEVEEHPLKCGRGFSFLLETETMGFCGLPLRSGNGMVVGFHVGRSKTNKKYKRAESITRQDVDAAREFFKSKGVISHVNSEVLPPSVDALVREANFSEFINEHSDVAKYGKFEGSIEASDHIPIGSLRHRDNGKMSARQSKLFGHFGHLCPPMGKPFNGKAIEWNGKWVSPALYRIRACIKRSETDVEMAMAAVSQMLGDIPVPVHALEPLDFFRAVCGDPENSLMNPRDSTKSVGFTLQRMGVTPESAFKKFGDEWKPHSKVLAEFNRLETIVRGNDPLPLSIYSATLKDEVYPLEKTARGKGRYFYVGDLSMNLLARKYLLPLTTYLMEMIKESGVVVTMNAGSQAWKAMYEHHARISDMAFGNDQKEMDLHQSAFMSYYNSYMHALALRCGYTEDNARIASRIIAMANRFVLIMENNFFIVHTTLCSGRWDTIIVNCLSGLWLTTRAVLTKLRRIPKRILTSNPVWEGKVNPYHDSLKTLMAGSYCGDDSIVSVKKEVGLTGEEFKASCAEEGYLLTSSDHTESVEEIPLKEITFLKRGFAWRDDDVLAPLEKNSIWKSLAYVCGVALDKEDDRNKGTSIAAVREMFMHGREDFDDLRSKLSNIFPDIAYPTYEDIVKERELGVYQSWQTAYATRKGYDQKRVDETVTNGSVCAGTGRVLSERSSDRVQTVESSNETYDDLIQESFTELNSNEPLVTQTTETPVTEIGIISQLSDVYANALPDFRHPTPTVELANFFARPRSLGKLSTGAFGGIDVFDNWKAIPSVDKIVQQYDLFRGNLKVTFTFTGSTAYMGKWRLWAYPFKIGDEYCRRPLQLPFGADDFFAFTTTSQLPHVDIDVSQVGTYVLELPFPLPLRYTQMHNGQDWTIYWSQVNPVTSISGLTPLELTGELFVEYHDVELDVIVPEGETTPGMISSILQYGSRIASRVNAPWANPLMHGLQFGASLAKFFGFSRPPVVQSTMVVNRHYGDLAYASGMPDFSHGLTLDPAVMKSVIGNYIPLSSPGETTFRSLVSRRCQLEANWQSEDAELMIPSNIYFNGGMSYPTTLSFASKMFEYWTGDIEICVEVISSPLIRWRIGVVIIPPGVSTPVVFPTDGTFLTTIIDVTGTTCTDITIPYLYYEPFQKYGVQGGMTTVKWFSLTDPVGPSATPIYPQVNLWIWGGKNFSVGVPTTEHIDDVVMEGITEGLGSASEITFGEIVDDLLLLTRRSSYLNGIAFAGGDFTISAQPFIPNLAHVGPTYIDTNQYMTFGTYLASAYLGESGGWCYKIVHQFYPDAVKEITTVLADIEPPTYVAGSSGKGVILIDGREEKIIEIRVPDRNTRTFRYTGSVFDGTSTYQSLSLATYAESAEPVSSVVFMANADDYRIGGFLCAPPFSVRV